MHSNTRNKLFRFLFIDDSPTDNKYLSLLIRIKKLPIEPHFEYYTSDQIPTWNEGNTTFRLVAGNGFGKSAPLQGHSPLFMVDIHAVEETTINLRDQIQGEVAFIVVKGSIKDEGEIIEQGQMLISKTNEECEISLAPKTQVLLFGGEPLEKEPRLMWNFVSHSKERLLQAKDDWINKRFPRVPNDDTYIPYPNQN